MTFRRPPDKFWRGHVPLSRGFRGLLPGGQSGPRGVFLSGWGHVSGSMVPGEGGVFVPPGGTGGQGGDRGGGGVLHTRDAIV